MIHEYEPKQNCPEVNVHNMDIGNRHRQSALTIVCLRFVLDCYGSLSHIFDRDRVVEAKRK